MLYKLDREVKRNSFKIGLAAILGLLIFLLATFMSAPKLDLQSKVKFMIGFIIAHLFMIATIYFGNRRFLKTMIFDFEKEILFTTSIIKTIKREIKISEIEEIKLIQSIGFINRTNGFRHYNLIVRVVNNYQPLIYEVINRSDFEKSNEIIKEFNTTPNMNVKIIAQQAKKLT